MFLQALDFVDRSGVKQIRLLGGEPTLHPEFISLLELALTRNKPIRIFSNGVMPEAALRFAATLPASQLSFIINLSASFDDPNRAHERAKSALARLGERVIVGLNISRPWSKFAPPEISDDIGYLLDLIDQYGLRRTIRIGLAHPRTDSANAFLHPNQYHAAGRRILSLSRRALERSVGLKLDCGCVPCMAPELLDSAFGGLSQQLRGHCGPVLDILPDGRVIPCFPLAGVHSVKLQDGHNANTLRALFERHLAGYREMGVWSICPNCGFRKQGACTGGCVAAVIKRFSSPRFHLRI